MFLSTLEHAFQRAVQLIKKHNLTFKDLSEDWYKKDPETIDIE